MMYIIISVIAYIVGSHIYELWLPCMLVAMMSLLKLIYVHTLKYVQKNNKIVGKSIEDYSNKELYGEILRRQKK